ncbi:MAG: hypothetical protein ACJAZH_000542 [Roseivirga sp.]|jgi:hypothetical protein
MWPFFLGVNGEEKTPTSHFLADILTFKFNFIRKLKYGVLN